MSFSTPEGEGPLLRERLRTARLYFVCDARPPGDLEVMLRAALGGGVDVVQLREKAGGRDAIERAASTYRRVADTYSALFIVNDDPALVRPCDADGVHVGEVGEVAAARQLLGPGPIVGVSTHSPEQIAAANEAAVDYIAVGPIWETPTKPGRPAVGLELIEHAAEHSRHPFFAIGGISPLNAEEVVRAGARRLCVVRAIRDAPHPDVAAEALRRAFGATEGAGRNSQDALLDSPAPWRGVAPGG
jgi:thiamine-phosphate pyrophosphorylase